MSALHVVVRPRPTSTPAGALAPLYGLFDVIVDGINITARIGEGDALALIAELSHAVALLADGRRDRVTLQLEEEQAWELGIERDGHHCLLTVFRAGARPAVAVHERRVELCELARGVERALAELQLRPAEELPRVASRTLSAARTALAAAADGSARPGAMRRQLSVEPGARQGFGFSGLAEFRVAPANDARRDASTVERADLHSLLVAGGFRITTPNGRAELGDTHLFLAAEQLMALAEEVVHAHIRARPLFRRTEVAGARIEVRCGADDGKLELRVTNAAAKRQRVIFCELSAPVFVRAACEFATSLGNAFTTTDPPQARNLRLRSLIALADALGEKVEDSLGDGPVTNPSPDSYRAFAPAQQRRANGGKWSRGSKMRFVARWVATVPNIDLSATFLCGDRIVVGSATETACLTRMDGKIRWRVRTAPAASVVAPSGLIRITPEGRLSCLDLETGEARFSLRVQPRSAGGAAGAVIYQPGLPRLLALMEGDRQITAVDLAKGEVRWRYTAPRAGAYRLRRAGKLLLVAGGDTSLVALDAADGEVVWRIRDRLVFSGAVAVDHDSGFAISGSPGGVWKLHHFDPWTGTQRWATNLEERPVVGRAPLLTPKVVVVPIIDEEGVGARGFDRATGALLWEHAPGLVSATTSWLAIDDAVVANSGAGILLCLDAETGTLRYNHVFSRNADADQPRRLEPVLRSGALFVPQHELHVVRPRDGELIGALPTDLIPDLLRVDERCDVYIAEESGHLAAFGAAPKLALVR